VSEFRAAVFSDVQAPYHDRDALDVAVQIMADHKPDTLFCNGDLWDLFNLSRFPSARTDITEKFAENLEEEIDVGVKILQHVISEVKPKRFKFNGGNHEWRVARAITNSSGNEKKLLELRVVRESYSFPRLFRFEEFGMPVEFPGQYPKGQWLHSSLAVHDNCWVEHGYTARKKSGYTCTALMEDRMSSVICGHCEKLALLWRHINGDRNYFGVEGGNLSILGVPGDGDDLYTGIPHSVPDYMNHTQGITLLTNVDGYWFPEIVRIVRGRSFWNGKLYKSRVKRSGQ
jgi:hypothetical protein